MKKSLQLTIQIALFLWLFTPSTLLAQVLATENFSGTSVGALTTGVSAAPWRYQGGTHACSYATSPFEYWEVANGTWGGSSTTGFSGNFAVCGGQQSCVHDAYLVVCRFTVPAGITSVKISYNHYYNYYSGDAGYVYVYDRTASAFLNSNLSYKSYTSDQGSFSSPVSDGFTLTGLTPGSTYDVRFRYTGSNDWYWLVDDVVVMGIPEDCTNAITLTPGAAGAACTTISGATGATQSQAGCVGTADDDVWYKFTATATSHTVTFSSVTGTTDIVHQVFSGSCGALTSIACTDTPDNTTLTGLTIGNTYYVRVYTYAGSGTATFDVCVTTPPAPPSNDNCSGAITLTPATTCTNTAGTTTNATQSQAGCVGTADDDVWYKFTATATSHTVTFSSVTGTTDIVHQVFSGTCGALTSLVCTDTPDNSTVTSLTIGNTYYIRVYTYFSGSASFNVCVTTPPAPPANDNCSGAIAMTVNPNGSNAATVTANTALATASNVTPTGACTSNTGTPDDDIWYSFVAPASGGVYLTGTFISGSSDVYYQIFSGSCASTMTSLLCTDTNTGGALTGLTPGSTYYVRFYTYSSATSVSYTLSLQAMPSYTYGSPDCSTATKLCTDGSTLTFGTNSTGNTPTGNTYSCLATTPRPNWFYVQMENPGDLTITVNGYDTNNSLVDIDFAVWGPYANLAAAQAACGTLPTPVDCNYSASATEVMNIPVSTTGQVYMILVTGYSTLSNHFTLQQTGGTGTTSCNGVAGACDISNVTLANLSVCNGNSTTIATDDYYTADVTVTFANKPATGNLELVGTGIHSGTYSVAVGSAGTTTYTFTGVKIKADGSSQSITAQFSAQTGCNFIKSGITAVASCSCAAGTMNMTITSP